jgi:hypothetical protein
VAVAACHQPALAVGPPLPAPVVTDDAPSVARPPARPVAPRSVRGRSGADDVGGRVAITVEVT